jgi:crotonobetainyl-CoA:carnitine CoA-transferase CaiB-like acyl-CoA transferase
LAEWDPILNRAGAIYGPVRTWPEIFADPEVRETMIHTLTHPNGKTFEVIDNPLRFSRTPTEIRSAPPTLGEHNDVLTATSIWHDTRETDQ